MPTGGRSPSETLSLIEIFESVTSHRLVGIMGWYSLDIWYPSLWCYVKAMVPSGGGV